MLPACFEPEKTALLLVLGVPIVSSVLLNRTIDRVGVPIVLLFLLRKRFFGRASNGPTIQERKIER